MGLDMYLYRYPKSKTKEQINKESDDLWEKGIDEWRKGFKEKYEVAYWRKVNFLHGYIVEHFADSVDECQPIPLAKEDFEEIASAVDNAIAAFEGTKFIAYKKIGEKDYQPIYAVDTSVEPIKIGWKDGKLTDEKALNIGEWRVEEDVAGKLSGILPTCPGFFFGSYSYDSWYVSDVYALREELKTILADWDDSCDYIYEASW